MNSPWCQAIVESITDDSHWKAAINFPSFIWQNSDFASNSDDSSNRSNEEMDNTSTILKKPLDNIFTTSTISSETNQTDIIKLFECNVAIQEHKLTHTSMINGYPKSALFCFENFTQFEQKEDLIDLLKRQSFATGTN
jgi:hypothetical protein